MSQDNRRQFTSDNRSGIVPEVWKAIAQANTGHTPSYGDDPWTLRAANLVREVFETDCDVYFTTTGTAANALALATLCQSYQSVICHDYAHIETDECGSPEFFSNGTKLLLAGGENGRIDPAQVRELVSKRSDIHYPRPRALSLTQATELGTVYSVGQVAELIDTAKSCGLRVHMDGARFANAIASLGCTPADLTWRAGVDVLCLGGTKCGAMGGEAVVFFDRSLSAEFAYRCKQAGQLLSKMRFAAAQWFGLLTDGTWLRYASHANTMARSLQTAVQGVSKTDPMFPVEANSVFMQLDPAVRQGLADCGWDLYSFIGLGGVRFMCSWDTQLSDVERLADDLRTCAAEQLNRQPVRAAVPAAVAGKF